MEAYCSWNGWIRYPIWIYNRYFFRNMYAWHSYIPIMYCFNCNSSCRNYRYCRWFTCTFIKRKVILIVPGRYSFNMGSTSKCWNCISDLYSDSYFNRIQFNQYVGRFKWNWIRAWNNCTYLFNNILYYLRKIWCYNYQYEYAWSFNSFPVL